MSVQKSKKAIISVTNDLVSDNRVHRTCTLLIEEGYEVILVGRKLPNSMPIQRNYQTHRFRLLFNKKVLFYAEYNLRLFIFLLFHRCDVLVSNDLDTLLANYYVSKIKRCALLYDSHEYFTEVPELMGRKRVKLIWEKIEQMIFPRLPFAITVCESIAEIYQRKYHVPVFTIRNVPIRHENIMSADISRFFKDFQYVLMYQGALNIGRGLELLIETMIYLDKKVVLLIAGKGDIENDLYCKVEQLGLKDRVKFLGKIPIDELNAYTLNADLGFSLEEDKGLNYRYALPNKLFDYIHASVPVISSDFPEMSRVVKQHNIGLCIKNEQRNPAVLAKIIDNLLDDSQQLYEWRNNCKKAVEEFNWDKERIKLKELIQKLVN